MRQVPTLELELILLCARMQIDGEHAKRIAFLLTRDIDWNGLVSLSLRHGLLPLLFRTLSGLGPGRVPVEVLDRLRSLFEAFQYRNLVYVRELHRAVQGLGSAGITAVPYKGAALAAYLYQDVALRQFVDIDLLVKPRDAIKARGILRDLGFIPKRQFAVRAEVVWVKIHSYFQFTALDGQITIELNWRVAHWFYRLPDIPDSAWDRLGHLSLAGVDVPWFAPQDLLFVLCLHASMHRWDTLKWLVDVAELLRMHQDLDWREVMGGVRRTGCERMLALGLFLANDLLDAPLPADVLEGVRSRPLVLSLATEVRNNLFSAHPEPLNNWTQLSFLARAAERLDIKLCCRVLPPLYFLLHRVVRPGAAALRRALAD